MGEIVNKVSESGLLTLDLERMLPEGRKMVAIDISDWMHQGLLLREKEFRERIKAERWEKFDGLYVAVFCSTDAIVPAWAYMLLSVALAGHALKIAIGSVERLKEEVFEEIIEGIDLSLYNGKSVVVKGCGDLPIPANILSKLTVRLKPVVKSIFYGEPCSTVPIYKKPKI